MRNAAHEGDDTELVSTAEAATLLGKSTATINRWAEDGTLPVAFRAPGIRGARFFTRDAVDAMKSRVA